MNSLGCWEPRRESCDESCDQSCDRPSRNQRAALLLWKLSRRQACDYHGAGRLVRYYRNEYLIMRAEAKASKTSSIYRKKSWEGGRQLRCRGGCVVLRGKAAKYPPVSRNPHGAPMDGLGFIEYISTLQLGR